VKLTPEGKFLKGEIVYSLGITNIEFQVNDAPFKEMVEQLKELNRLHKDRERKHEARKCEREFIKKYGDLYFNIVYRRGADYCLSKGVNPTSSSPQYNMRMWVTDVGPCFYLGFIKKVRELRKWSGFILEAAKAFDRIGKRWLGRPPYPKIPWEKIDKWVREYEKKGHTKKEAWRLVAKDQGWEYGLETVKHLFYEGKRRKRDKIERRNGP